MRGPYHKHNRIIQEYKMHSHSRQHINYRICVSTQSTLRSAKHFNNALHSSTHHIRIRQWERNETILTSNFGMNS